MCAVALCPDWHPVLPLPASLCHTRRRLLRLVTAETASTAATKGPWDSVPGAGGQDSEESGQRA